MKTAIRNASLLVVLGFIVLVCTPAWSNVTYTYTGNPFTSWGSGYQCPPVCDVVGSFTVALPLAPNLPELTDAMPISMTLTSGGVTLTLGINCCVPAETQVAVSTDAFGNIVYFSFVMYGDPNTARILAQYVSLTGGTFDDIRYLDAFGNRGPIAGINYDDPGTWSVTPEPGTLSCCSAPDCSGPFGALRRKINL